MGARERILGRLRQARQPFTAVEPIANRRPVVPQREMTKSQRLEQFINEAETLGCTVYQLDRNEAVEQIMDLLDGDKSVLAWAEEQLPFHGLHGILDSLGVRVGRHDDGDVRVGLTGVSAALAATGSLVLESGAGRYRSSSLLPDLHIALMTAEQLLPDLESWQEAQAGGWLSRIQEREQYGHRDRSEQDGGHRASVSERSARSPREVPYYGFDLTATSCF